MDWLKYCVDSAHLCINGVQIIQRRLSLTFRITFKALALWSPVFGHWLPNASYKTRQSYTIMFLCQT